MNKYLLEYMGYDPSYGDWDFIQKIVKADSEEEAAKKAGIRKSGIKITKLED